MKRWERTCLLDLPVLPHDRDSAAATDYVIKTFVAERSAIPGPAAIRPFVRRWRSAWLLQSGMSGPPGTWVHWAHEPLDPYDRRLLEGDFDAKKIWAVLQSEGHGPESKGQVDLNSANTRIAAGLMIPVPLMLASQLAHDYGVGHDLGLVRLYLDTYPQHSNRLRNGIR